MLLKKRLLYLLLITIVMALGLSTRKFSDAMPPFVALHFGDALWAAMVYFGFRALLPAKPLLLSLLLGLSFSFLIEFSQLYNAPWLNSIRASTMGALVFGKGFLWIDLARYTAGTALAYCLDLFLNRFHIITPLGGGTAHITNRGKLP
ncbi:DUF2809 domain-containing protein [Cesiribacter sp. SM1]|uniref:ribosomal maturation YjgA family protein n=1 Tax=Cesiribacter sp. SM1 TaxID=2861196 RepID=UPI001CD1A921|nr:DUF2809 domain-containing protein [Cesiribacter sp. SM1]